MFLLLRFCLWHDDAELLNKIITISDLLGLSGKAEPLVERDCTFAQVLQGLRAQSTTCSLHFLLLHPDLLLIVREPLVVTFRYPLICSHRVVTDDGLLERWRSIARGLATTKQA